MCEIDSAQSKENVSWDQELHLVLAVSSFLLCREGLCTQYSTDLIEAVDADTP